jgi:hypothetical protein
MKKILIILIPLLTGCHSFTPVSQMDNYRLYQEYLDMQYELSEKEQEYDNLISSYLFLDPSYKPSIKGYKVTGERPGIRSSGFTKYELTPVYDHSNAPALDNIGSVAERKKAEKEIGKLKARISEMESELSRRELSPDKQRRGPTP